MRGAGAGAIFDNDRLSPFLREPLRDGAGDSVGAAARRVRDDDFDGPVRIVLRLAAAATGQNADEAEAVQNM